MAGVLSARMITDDYPDDCVTQAVPGGRPALALAATAIEPDAFEEEEPERPESAIGYGSLLSLGSTMRKKKPLIVIDPVEAENEARRVQFVAAQQLVDPDEADGIEFRECPAIFVEPDDEPESEELGAPIADEEPLPEWNEGDIVECGEMTDDMAPTAEAVEAAAEADVDELAIAVEGLAKIYEAHDLAPLPVNAEPELLQDEEAPRLEPLPAPHGHSLRARMPTHTPHRKLGDRAFAVLAWLRNWLTRPR